MQTQVRCLLAVLAVTAIIAVGAGSALALRSLLAEGSRLTFSGQLSIAGGGVTVECPTTLVKTVSGAWPKISGVLIGKITEIRFNRAEARCRSSTGTLLAVHALFLGSEAVGRAFYEAISGTLPRITAVGEQVKNLEYEFEVELLGVMRCLYAQEEGGKGAAVETQLNERQLITKIVFGRNVSSRARGSVVCPERVVLRGEVTASAAEMVQLRLM
jgi:hypothetical protein